MTSLDFFSLLPENVIWGILSNLELKSLLLVLQASKKSAQILADEEFWFYLYYHQLMSSPLYYDIQHNDFIQTKSASWRYLYLEQLWVQYLHLNYAPSSEMKYIHRTLSRELDGKWLVVDETPRAQIGPFEAICQPITFCYHLGFKRPKNEPALDDGEVTGCFNWNNNLQFADLESGIGSLLSFPSNSSINDRLAANKLMASRVDTWCARHADFTDFSKINLEWIVTGARSFVAAISRSIESIGSYSDYWRECDELVARKFVKQLLSKRPSLPEAISSSSSLQEDLNNMSLKLTSKNMANFDDNTAQTVVDAIFRLSKIGPLSASTPMLDTPARFFICANAKVTPFELRHQYAIILMAIDRVIILTWDFVVPEELFQAHFEQTVIALKEYVQEF